MLRLRYLQEKRPRRKRLKRVHILQHAHRARTPALHVRALK
jgi:hypothetical protein